MVQYLKILILIVTIAFVGPFFLIGFIAGFIYDCLLVGFHHGKNLVMEVATNVSPK